MTLHATLQESARRYPDRPWLQCEDERWTYAAGDAHTNRIAAGLLRLGVKAGDRVALLFTNCPEIVFCYFACFKIGAIAVPLNTRFQAPELVFALNHAEAVMLIGQSDLCGAIVPRRADLAHLSHICVTGAPMAGTSAFSDLCRDTDPSFAFAEVSDEQVAVILYTSGTTARPKGVIHTHATLLRQNANYLATCGAEVYSVTAIFLPLCHIAGFSFQLLVATQAAGEIWLIPRFDPEIVLRTWAESKATFSGGLPVHLNMLVNCPGADRHDLRSLRLLIGGGDSVPMELQNRVKALFGICLDELCGMTEIIHSMQPHLAGERRAGSIGKPIGDVRIRLEDPDGREVAPGEVGEIVLFSGAVTPGYWNDPGSTEAAFRNGGLRSGDLARRDEDGFYWFAGRSKDIIIRSGSNISPGEVEDVLYAHPAIFEVGVVGIPDSALGQRVHAYVTLKPGAQVTEAVLIAWAGERIAHYKIPESIVFVDQLPKGPTGKILRKALRDMGADQSRHAGPGAQG